MRLRGFKITDRLQTVRRGIAARTFAELQQRTVDKFHLKTTSPNNIYFQLLFDDTTVEDETYFQQLPPQTLMVWRDRKSSTLTEEPLNTDFLREADLLYATVCKLHEEAFKAGSKAIQFFTEDTRRKLEKLLQAIAARQPPNKDQTLDSTKEDHPEWFLDVNTRSKTKEDYLFRRAQDRIRTYYYKTREELLKCSSKSTEITPLIRALFTYLHQKLQSNQFHGFYFDRRHQMKDLLANEERYKTKTPASLDTLCNSCGVFQCGGQWQRSICEYGFKHIINPYSSREERILFSTWNLDHGKERSRSIVPAIRVALHSLLIESHRKNDENQAFSCTLQGHLFSRCSLDPNFLTIYLCIFLYTPIYEDKKRVNIVSQLERYISIQYILRV